MIRAIGEIVLWSLVVAAMGLLAAVVLHVGG